MQKQHDRFPVDGQVTYHSLIATMDMIRRGLALRARCCDSCSFAFNPNGRTIVGNVQETKIL
ncbi:hypothetical protein [Reticulibacter mediterranei]|uniref:hypothetical protein n=1 Tax=Reticulibacter mediterranei TaxID=2778369 RepID=UPI001F3F69C7|nr:hypothetical protein [Reticulibacter mediterranei]